MAHPGSVAVVGVGHTRYGKLPEYDAYDLGLWALKEALADSGLRFEDIDGLIVNRIPDYQRFCEIAGLNPSYVSTTPGQGRFSGICIETAAALIRDGLATIVSGVAGGTGVTTYAENIGVMAVTKICSSRVFVIAALFAILLGFSPKFGAVILSIPRPVVGGLSILLFGLIAATAARIWVENKVDFSRPGNLVTVGTSLVLGAGNLAIDLGGFTLGGIGTATFGAIIINQLLGPRGREAARTRAGAPA